GEGAASTPTTTLDNCTLIGNGADCSDNLSLATAIGAGATVATSNSIVLGTIENVGIGTTAPTARLHVYGGQVVKQDVTLVAPGSYTVLVSDYIVKFDTTSAAASALLPNPNAPSNGGQVFIFKDWAGNAGTNNITITVDGGANIDGASSYVINSDYGSVTVFSDSFNYFVI
ncbi:MAG TPA: hypothetical protein VGF75_00965, partial [Candidatus Saccharimonadales bacterium]